MGADQHNDWKMAAASALEWWADAGVDVLVEDQVRDWFAAAARIPAAIAPAPAAPADAGFPDTLDAFLAWRTREGAPEAGWNAPMVAGEGDPRAAFMILLDLPTGDRLLTDPESRLLDRMLAAIGLARGDVYVTALALAEPLARAIPEDAMPALVARARHLAGLAGTKRLILLSQTASGAFFATGRATARGRLHAINHPGGTVDAVASLHPRFLLENPAHKREAWKDLQLLIGGKHL